MALYQLRHFDFYECQPVTSPPSLFEEPDLLLKSLGNHLYAADSSGRVHILDSEFNIRSFVAYDSENYRVTQMAMVHMPNELLITVGEQASPSLIAGNEPSYAPPLIKVWELERTTNFLNRKINLSGRSGNLPYCIKSLKINGTNSKITCFALSELTGHTAIGLEDGQVILIKGNIAKDRFPKQKVIHSCSEPITGLGFSDFRHTETDFVPSETQENQLNLFITTTRQIIICTLTGREEKTVLDEQGCSIGCASMVDTNFHRGISMARDDAFYFYSPDGRGPCLAYEGPKSHIQWFGSQLIIASPDLVGDPLSLHHSIHEERRAPTQLEIYDVGQKLVGFSSRFQSGISQVVFAFGGLFVLCNDGTLHRIEERDTRTKLEILLNQDLHHLAITIATKGGDSSITREELAEIHRKYADFLYEKGDYEAAMNQYLGTIGSLEPSYVIRKFLDAQRLRSLTTYLQELHTQGLANPDHTTLLLNCYTKLKDVAQLDQFLKTSNSNSESSDLLFDLETAIKVLRGAAFYDHALLLAQRHQHHDWYMQIQVENIGDMPKALEYLKNNLSSDEILSHLNRYGRSLISACPESTLQLLLATCKTNPLDHLSLFVDHPDHLMTFLEDFCATRLHRDLRSPATPLLTSPPPRIVVQAPISPRNSQHIDPASAAIWNTLLDLYLTRYTNDSTLSKRIMTLLRDPEIPYDINHAMVLCKLSGFDEAIVFLYERLEMFVDILNHWIAQDNVKKILESLRKYGPRDPTLYTLTLEYFASSPISLLSSPMEFRQVLDYIDDQGLLPPVQVIQALARNSVATIGNLKQFVRKSLHADTHRISQDEKLIESYRAETAKKRRELEELETSARIFQHTKCSSCSRPLDLPALHFLCRHSFHQRCLGQSTNQCPLCSRGDQIILDLKRRQEAEAYDHGEFITQVQEAGDDGGFDVITEYLAKNTFQYTSLTN